MTEQIHNLARQDEMNESIAYMKANHAPEARKYFKSRYADKVAQEDYEFYHNNNGHK